MSQAALMRLVVIAAIAGFIALLWALPVEIWLGQAQRWVSANPMAGALLFVVGTIIIVVAMTPGWIPMMLGGFLFGMSSGTVYTIAGITLGATAAMLVGRTLARSWVETRIKDNERLAALDEALQDQAFLIVMLTRVAVVIPYNILNYAYGLTRVRAATYTLATLFGMLPITLLYVYIGTLARDIGQIMRGELQPGDEAWWFAAIAVVAIATVLIVVRRAVSKVLDRKIQQGGT